MYEQLNTIDDMVDKIDELVIDMGLPAHVTRSVCNHLYAFYSDLEAAVVYMEGPRDEQAAIEQEKNGE